MLFDEPTNVDVFATKGKVFLIDFQNLMFRTAYGTIAKTPEDNYDFALTKHNLLNNIMYNIDKFTPNQIVFAIDSKDSWRYGVYPEYKANRKDRSTSLNVERLYPIIDDYMTDLAKLFSNMRFLKLPKCEADDIIAVLCKHGLKNAEITILSGDSDMHQLLSSKNIRQYDALKSDFVNCINPKNALEIKIISGDTSDNIKGVRPRVGPKTAEKIIVEGLMSYIDDPKNKIEVAEKKDILEKYKRNKTLIDFDCIPIGIRTIILNAYKEYELKPIPRSFVMEFFGKHNLIKLMEDWSTRSAKIRAIGGF